MSSTAELRGLLAGLTAVVKQQAEAQKATTAQIAQLTDNLLTHGPHAATTPLRMPTLELPRFTYDQTKHDSVEEFMELFNEQSSHLNTAAQLALLQQSCIGDWPNSVLAMEKMKFTAETTPQQKLDGLKNALLNTFAEPQDVQRRRLASEFSNMKQYATEPIDQFAFRFKNNLHRLAKLGETVEESSPNFIMSHFISKTRSEIQRHLVLKAEEYKNLSDVIEAAKRIERSFNPVSSSATNLNRSSNTNSPKVLAANSTSQRCYQCNKVGHLKRNCPANDRSARAHVPSNAEKEICRLWNKHQRSPCTKADQSCKYGRLHQCDVCSKPGCKHVNHKVPSQALASELNPPQSRDQPPVPTLFGMPTCAEPKELSVNLNRNILSCTVTSAGTQLQLPIDSCCSVTLCSLAHAQHIQSARPELNYKKLEKSIPVQMADSQSSLTAVAVQEVPILWLPGKETIHVALVVPNMSWPLLFGENHLEATQALTDHSAKTVTFRHPAMNFTVSCDKPSSSQPPHAAVTCLLTGRPSTDPTPSQTTVRRGLNLMTAYLTLSAASFALMGPDLWLTGHELEPGVKVLSGPLSATLIRPVMAFPLVSPDHQPDIPPDFSQPLVMNVLVQRTKKSATTAARAIFDHVFLKLGFASVLLSDRGGEFLNAVLRELSRLLSIKQVFTSGYRPRSNGSTERVHRFLNSALAIYASKWQKQWEDYLQPAAYSHNTSVIDGTDSITPFLLMFGRHATSPETVALQLPNEPISRNEYAKHLVQRVHEAHKLFSSVKVDLRRRQRDYYDLGARSRDLKVGQQVLVRKPPPSNVEKGSATKLIRRYAGPYIITERIKDSDLYRLRHCTTDNELPPTNVEKLIPVPDVDPNDIRDSCQQRTHETTNTQEGTQYQPGRFIMYLPVREDQADEGISLRLAQYLEPLGKAPVSEACKHLYSVYPPARQLLAKLGRMRGLTAHCPYLSLEGDPSGGAYNVVLDKAAFQKATVEQGFLVAEIVELDEEKETVVAHTYAPTGRRSRLTRSRVWKPLYNHNLSKKSLPMDKAKRLMDYSPDLDRVDFKRIIALEDSLDKLLSVRDMDNAVSALFLRPRFF